MTRTPRPRHAPRTARSKAFIALAVVAVLTVLGGATAPWAYSSFVDTTAKDRIAAAPPPTRFPDDDLAPLGQRIAQQQATARHLMAGWWADHDATADDTAFITWLEATLPGPPSSTARAAEIKQVQQIAPTRTTAGVAAATWLEAYGKKDIWKLYAHDQNELLASSTGKDRKAEEKAILKMSKHVADDLGTQYGSSAPYVRMPALRKDHAVTQGQKCPCSYPSRHAAAGAASRTLLGTLMPDRAAEYRATEAQIDYSRIYMAGHFPGDIRAGALLGDLIGDYFLITRNGLTLAKLA